LYCDVKLNLKLRINNLSRITQALLCELFESKLSSVRNLKNKNIDHLFHSIRLLPKSCVLSQLHFLNFFFVNHSNLSPKCKKYKILNHTSIFNLFAFKSIISIEGLFAFVQNIITMTLRQYVIDSVQRVMVSQKNEYYQNASKLNMVTPFEGLDINHKSIDLELDLDQVVLKMKLHSEMQKRVLKYLEYLICNMSMSNHRQQHFKCHFKCHSIFLSAMICNAVGRRTRRTSRNIKTLKALETFEIKGNFKLKFLQKDNFTNNFTNNDSVDMGVRVTLNLRMKISQVVTIICDLASKSNLSELRVRTMSTTSMLTLNDKACHEIATSNIRRCTFNQNRTNTIFFLFLFAKPPIEQLNGLEAVLRSQLQQGQQRRQPLWSSPLFVSTSGFFRHWLREVLHEDGLESERRIFGYLKNKEDRLYKIHFTNQFFYNVLLTPFLYLRQIAYLFIARYLFIIKHCRCVENKCKVRVGNSICQTNYKLNNICFHRILTRLVLVFYLGSGFTLSPMKPMSRDTSLGWLCGHKNESKLGQLKITKNINIFQINILNQRINANLKFHIWLETSKLSYRHAISLARISLYNDIELNPGPLQQLTEDNKTIKIYTINCRGLGKITKFRLILNKAYDLLKENSNSIIMLQETMVKDDKYLQMAWRGNFIITPGLGNSQGCITLIASSVMVSNQKNFGNRGHYAELDGLASTKIALLNIYAPNGYANNKRDFFLETIDSLEESNCHNIVMAGDFNLTFGNIDRHNRDVNAGEINLANLVAGRLQSMGLRDAWHGNNKMTWKRGNVMSCLDRIYTRLSNYRQVDIDTDWTFCNSDHAMVRATFKGLGRKPRGVRPCRLDPKVVMDMDSLAQLRAYLIEQLNTIDPAFNPHFVLEFAKMTIRTKALELGKKLLDAETTNLKLIDEDIKVHVDLLRQPLTVEEEEDIVAHLERQKNEKDKILELQGKSLAWKARTKWYNDGEKSNKYFLNMLKRSSTQAEMVKLQHDGRLICELEEINATVNDYYGKLYNQKLDTEAPETEIDFLSTCSNSRITKYKVSLLLLL
jgi:exonuclease III